MGHARALIGVEDVDKQLFIFHEIVRNRLSVRQVEELVRRLTQKNNTAPAKSPAIQLPQAYQKIQDQLASHFATKVKLNRGKNGKGNITIEFYSDHELDRLLELIDIT
jgi:ParB family chromosome partitioning protein